LKPIPTDDTLRVGVVLECGQSKVADLDQSSRARDEDVVAFEIAVDDRWRPTVKEAEALEDLATPVLDDFDVDLLQTLLYIPCANRNSSLVR